MAVDISYDIELNGHKLTKLLSCVVRKSANKLGDTATITIPGMAYNAALEIESKLKREDPVSIKLGYNEILTEEFVGWISTVATDNTIIIECEDNIFLTRKEVRNEVFKDVSLADVVKSTMAQIDGLTVEVSDDLKYLRYDKFTIQDATAWDVLKKLKDENRIHIFCKGTVLHVALKFTYNSGSVKFDFEKNIEKSSLTYKKAEYKKVLVKVVGINRKNQKVKRQVGKTGGDVYTIHRYNVSDPAALDIIGNEELKQYLFTGYEGTITTWLMPYCTYGYAAEIKDPDYLEREGVYYVEGVTTTVDKTGGKRVVNLSILLS